MFITKNFIEKVHCFFDELNYHETKQLDIESFEKAATKTLTHAKGLTDAIEVVRMYQFCLKNWSKIEKIFNNKLHIFNSYSYEGNALVETVSDEESFGTCYITNGINNKVKDIVVASNSFEDEEEMFSVGSKNGRFTIFEDGEYYIKYSKMSSVKMKLFDNNNDCLANIVLSEDLGIFLEKNRTKYEIILYEDLIGIYDKNYIDSLSDTDLIDTEKMIAAIEWDILEKKSKFGVAKINFYNVDVDIEMILLFATSTFLVFQRYIEEENKKNSRINNNALLGYIMYKR